MSLGVRHASSFLESSRLLSPGFAVQSARLLPPHLLASWLRIISYKCELTSDLRQVFSYMSLNLMRNWGIPSCIACVIRSQICSRLLSEQRAALSCKSAVAEGLGANGLKLNDGSISCKDAGNAAWDLPRRRCRTDCSADKCEDLLPDTWQVLLAVVEKP